MLSLTSPWGKGPAPIGIFDSGYGGLTILNEIRRELPEYDFLYLGDNARTPYGTRSFDVVYKFTLQCVEYLFSQGCHLIILACNTASAKALRTIQQNVLPNTDPLRRVLGVIRPTVEAVGKMTVTNHIGLFATSGTVLSNSYPLEIRKIYPDVRVVSEACPMWVPLIENNEYLSPGADYFVRKHAHNLMKADNAIDTIILGCTHYPLLKGKIEKELPDHVSVISQGEIVARSLADYLLRHPEMDQKCSKNSSCRYLTTENPGKFSSSASIFLSDEIRAQHVEVEV
ncbi:MAG: glutamate racemase [Paludibacteraceae bacterium]|nr:glutamate racemase [Paludibacteraceae bacterium]